MVDFLFSVLVVILSGWLVYYNSEAKEAFKVFKDNVVWLEDAISRSGNIGSEAMMKAQPGVHLKEIEKSRAAARRLIFKRKEFNALDAKAKELRNEVLNKKS